MIHQTFSEKCCWRCSWIWFWLFAFSVEQRFCCESWWPAARSSTLKGDKCLEFVTDLSICRRQILLRQIVALLMPFFAIPPPILGDSQKVCSRNPITSSDVYSSPDYAFLGLCVAYPFKFRSCCWYWGYDNTVNFVQNSRVDFYSNTLLMHCNENRELLIFCRGSNNLMNV